MSVPGVSGAAKVPGMGLDGYFYAEQEIPFVIPPELSGLGGPLAVNSIRGWLVPSEEDEVIGVALEFPNDLLAGQGVELFRSASHLWKYLQHNKLYLVKGKGSGAETLQRATVESNFVLLEQNMPEAWTLLRQVVEMPLLKPVLIGFSQVNEKVIKLSSSHPKYAAIRDVPGVLAKLNIQTVAYAVFSPVPLDTSRWRTAKDLKGTGVGGLVIAKSGYPGFLISAAISTAAPLMGVESREIEGKKVFVSSWLIEGERIYIMGFNRGNLLFASLAFEPAVAQNILTQVIKGK